VFFKSSRLIHVSLYKTFPVGGEVIVSNRFNFENHSNLLNLSPSDPTKKV